MKKNRTSLFIFALAALVMIVTMTVAQIFAFLRYFDFENNLWLADTPGLIQGLVYIMAGLAALFAVAYAFTVGKTEPAAQKTSLSSRIGGALAALAVAATLIAQFAVIGSDDHLYLMLVSSSRDYVAFAAAMHVVTLILAIPTLIRFVKLILGKALNFVDFICPTLYFMALTLRVYFDITVHLNNPRWAFHMPVLVMLFLYFFFEARLTSPVKRIPLYRTFAMLTMILAAASGISAVILNVMGYFADGAQLTYYVLELVVAVYIALRLAFGDKEEEVPEEQPDELSEDELDTELVSEAVIEEAEEVEKVEKVEEEDTLSDLSEEEVKNFYAAVFDSILTRRKDISDPPTKEELQSIKKEAFAVIQAVLKTEDREQRLTAVRSYLQKKENR